MKLPPPLLKVCETQQIISFSILCFLNDSMYKSTHLVQKVSLPKPSFIPQNQTRQTRKPEQRIKQEMSNLVVYFRAVRCDPSKQFVYGGTHNEVSSFPENRMESLILSCPKGLLKFHKVGQNVFLWTF